MIFVVVVEFILTGSILLHLVKHNVTVNDRVVDIDNNISIDDTAVITAAIDIATFQTAILISSTTGDGTL